MELGASDVADDLNQIGALLEVNTDVSERVSSWNLVPQMLEVTFVTLLLCWRKESEHRCQ